MSATSATRPSARPAEWIPRRHLFRGEIDRSTAETASTPARVASSDLIVVERIRAPSNHICRSTQQPLAILKSNVAPAERPEGQEGRNDRVSFRRRPSSRSDFPRKGRRTLPRVEAELVARSAQEIRTHRRAEHAPRRGSRRRHHFPAIGQSSATTGPCAQAGRPLRLRSVQASDRPHSVTIGSAPDRSTTARTSLSKQSPGAHIRP